MKYLGIVSDPKDLTNKQYVDGKVGEVNTSLTTLSGRVDTAEDNIQMAESDIGDLQTETNTLKTDMTTVKGAVKTLQDTYVPNTTKVNGQALSGDVTIEAVQYTSQTLTASQKEQARTNIGAGTSNFSGNYNDLTNKPDIPEGTFIITLSTTDGQTYTCDKTSAEINAAYDKGCTLMLRSTGNGSEYETLYLSLATPSNYIFQTTPFEGGIVIVAILYVSNTNVSVDIHRTYVLTDAATNLSNSTKDTMRENIGAASKPTTLTSTLSAGSTTLTLSDTAITTSSTIDIYTDKWGVNPTDVAVETGKITLTFDKQSAALGVKVEVR